MMVSVGGWIRHAAVQGLHAKVPPLRCLFCVSGQAELQSDTFSALCRRQITVFSLWKCVFHEFSLCFCAFA